MLHDLAIFQPEEVGQRASGLAVLQSQVRVRCNHVAFGDDAFDLEGQMWMLRSEPIYVSDERLGAVRGVQVVLDVRIA